jgi:hypothetical protein
MTIGDRRNSERQLLQRYLDALIAAGVADAPETDEMWSLYRIQMAYGLYAWLTNLEAFQQGDIIDEVISRFAAAVLDLNTAEAVGLN